MIGLPGKAETTAKDNINLFDSLIDFVQLFDEKEPPKNCDRDKRKRLQLGYDWKVVIANQRGS